MAKEKTKEFSIELLKEGFFPFRKHTGKKEEYDFSSIATIRQLLSNEKIRMLDAIKNQKPKSIYALAKKLGRNFKAVNEDIKLLERFELIELVAEKTGKRERHMPIANADKIVIKIGF